MAWESNGKQQNETPTVHKAPSLPLRPMPRTSQPPESDTARRPLHGDAASSRVLSQGGGASSSAIMARRGAASPCLIRLASHSKETYTPVATASRLAFGSGDISRCVTPTRHDAAITTSPPHHSPSIAARSTSGPYHDGRELVGQRIGRNLMGTVPISEAGHTPPRSAV